MTYTSPDHRFSWIRIAQMLIIVGMIAAALWLYPSLPERIPTHWGWNGTVDGWMPKMMGLLFTPLLAVGLSLLFPFLERIDPLKKNYALFRPTWERLQVILVGFFAYIYGLQLWAALHPAQASLVSRAMLFGMGILFALLGNSFGKIRHNYFIGIKTPWTLADPEIWNRTHRMAGWLWVAAGLIAIVDSILWIGQPFVIFLIAIIVASVVPIGYSYYLFRQKKAHGYGSSSY